MLYKLKVNNYILKMNQDTIIKIASFLENINDMINLVKINKMAYGCNYMIYRRCIFNCELLQKIIKYTLIIEQNFNIQFSFQKNY